MQVVKHNKSGKKYLRLWNTKIKKDGVWLEGIIYLCLYYNKDGMIWVRFKDDFENNFK